MTKAHFKVISFNLAPCDSYAKNHTDDLSTFDAEFAHFTSASKRMNNCLVRAEKL